MRDEAAWRVGEDRQPLGQLGTGGGFGVRNEIHQNAVEQIDVIGPEARSPKQEQFGDPPGRLGAAFGIAMLDDLIELGDQGGSECH